MKSNGPHYHTGKMDEGIDLVMRYHYSRRPPRNVQLVCTAHYDGGLFGDYGAAVAALFYTLPPTRWSEDVWELSRLVRADVVETLTGLISFSTKAAKRKGANLLVSFADKTHGHHGGIYQAASWFYAGARNRSVDGCIVDGQFIPGRACNHKWGTRSPAKISERIGRECLPHYDEGKHLYWKPLTSEGKRRAARLGLSALSYPKPDFQ